MDSDNGNPYRSLEISKLETDHLFIALAEGGGGDALALRLVVQEIGIGLVVGLGLAGAGAYLLRACWHRGWVNKIWMQITIPALALACFAIAQSLHGSGYIAAFSGGLLFGFTTKEATHKLVFAGEGIGNTLAMLTWTIFGASVIGQTLGYFEWEMVLYAVLSLTVIRILPIFLSLSGTGESTSSKMFLGRLMNENIEGKQLMIPGRFLVTKLSLLLLISDRIFTF